MANVTDTPEARQRAVRGSEQIQRDGKDPVTGRPRFFVRFTVNGKRHFARLEATNIEQARAEFEERKKAARENRPFREAPRPAGMTVRELCVRFTGYVEDPEQPGRFCKETSWKKGHGADNRDPKKYRHDFWNVLNKHVLPTFGNRPAEQIKPPEVVRLRGELSNAGKSAYVVVRVIQHLSQVFDWSVENGLIECLNPCTNVSVKIPKGNPKPYSEAEIARLFAIAAAENPTLYTFMVFAFYTGCRRGEYRALQVGDCDLQAGKLSICRSGKYNTRKSGEALTVHVHPVLAATLAPHLAGKKPTELVFPGRKGKMRSEKTWGIRELLTKAGIPQPRHPWHKFRHNTGTTLAATGAGMGQIQAALGQATLEMAKRYTKIASEMTRAPMLGLPDITPPLPSNVTPIHRDRQSVGLVEELDDVVGEVRGGNL